MTEETKAQRRHEPASPDVRQLARDAVHALYRGDRAAVDRVYRSVPRRKCVVLDRKFEALVDGLSNLKTLWAADWWRERWAAADALLRLHDAIASADPVLEGVCRQQHLEAEARLLAADKALDEVCTQYGLDAALMRESSRIERYEATNAGAACDPECERYGTELRALMRNLLRAAGAEG